MSEPNETSKGFLTGMALKPGKTVTATLKENITSIGEIDTSTEVGQLLSMAIAKISTESQTDKQPDEILAQIQDLRNHVYVKHPKEKSRIESFKEAAAPLVNWLKKNCDPHATAIVNDAYAELKTGELGVPFDENYIQYERLNFQIEKRDVK